MNYSEKINELREKKHQEGKYSIFDTDFSKKLKLNNTIFEIMSEWNEKCDIPTYTGDFLNTLTNDSKNIVAIHRIFVSDLHEEDNQIKSDMIADIAEHGLINKTSNELTPLKELEGFIKLVASYRNNDAVIIYSFPSEYIDENLLLNTPHVSKIYNFEGNTQRYNPEYIVGMILKNNNSLNTFLSREDMLNLKSNSKNR